MSAPIPERLFLTVAEFCDACGISKASFYRAQQADTGPRLTKLGSRTLISRDALEEWVDRVDGQSTATSKPTLTLDQALRGYRR
jgi:predicted DNA-binding transcriptional regulator AlpA